MHMTVADRFRPAAARASWAYDIALVVGASALLALSAQVALRLPISPVPVTGQTLAVLLLGALLGSRRGVAAVGLYLLEGACGLPVFAQGAAGLPYMLGPTGGYLAGFLAGAYLAGRLAERGWDRSPWRMLAAVTIADAALFLPGVAYLSVLMGPQLAVTTGLLPFLPGEALKIALAAALLPGGWRLVRRHRGSSA